VISARYSYTESNVPASLDHAGQGHGKEEKERQSRAMLRVDGEGDEAVNRR
jgi:hypothetical protein